MIFGLWYWLKLCKKIIFMSQIFLIPVTELILVFQSVIQILNCIY